MHLIHSLIKLPYMVLLVSFFCATASYANEAEHLQKTIAQHQAMAKAHTQAAQCLAQAKNEAGEKACHEQLQKACKGVGIGKYCGMKHGH